MKKLLTITAFLMVTLACSLVSRVPIVPSTSTNNNQPPQVTAQNTQEIIPSAQRDWSMSNTVPPYILNGVTNATSSQWLNVWGSSPVSDSLRIFNDKSALLTYQSYYVANGVLFFSDANQQPTAVDMQSGDKVWQSDMKATTIGLATNTLVVYRDDNRIYGLDKDTGQERWKVIVAGLVPDGQPLQPFPYIVPGQGNITIPMLSRDNNSFDYWNIQFLNINETNGNTKLTEYNKVPNMDTPLAYSNGLVITQALSIPNGYTGCRVGTKNTNSIAGVNPALGTETWIYVQPENSCLEVLDTDFPNSVMFVENYGTAGFGSEIPTDLIALDTKTGRNIWGNGLLAKNNIVAFEGSYLFRQKYVYFVTPNDVYSFQKETGILISKFSPERNFNAYFSENGGMVISYPELGTSNGVDLSSSQELWKNDDLALADYLITVGDILVFQDKNTNEILGLDQKTGQVLWKKFIQGYSDPFISIYANNFIIYNNVIFYKDAEFSRIYLLDPISGDNRIIIDQPLDARTIQPLQDNLWLIEYSGQLSLTSLK